MTAVALLTLFGFLADYSFFFNTLSHFRVQYAMAAAGGLLLFGFLRNKTWSLIASVVLVVNLAPVLPLYISQDTSPVTESPNTSVGILLMNVLSSNRRTEAVVAEINRFQPDIIVLEEVTPRWFTALADLSAEYPYQVHEVRTDNFGIWVLSRRPLSEGSVVHWGAAQLPTVTFRYPIDNHGLQVVALHPMSPATARGLHLRNEQLREVAQHYEDDEQPLLIIGDLNTTSFAPIFSELTHRLGLRDSRRGFGLQSTWPAWSFAPLMIAIDHCLVSPTVQVVRREVGHDVGSDHLPVYVEVAIL